MNKYLVFQLCAPMASWGDTAVGEMRPSRNEPGQSSILGLLAAALGITREDENANLVLREGYAFTFAVLSEGQLLRDYHTTQVVSQSVLSEQPHKVRGDELVVPPEKRKKHLNTILSTRDYRQDVQMLVAVESKETAPYPLEKLSKKLNSPEFTLYLGRKSCPLAAPLWPRIEPAEHALAACKVYLTALAEKVSKENLKWWDRNAQPCLDTDGKPLPIRSLHWSNDCTVGIAPTFSVPRKDHLLSRKRWQFEDRIEHITPLPDKD